MKIIKPSLTTDSINQLLLATYLAWLAISKLFSSTPSLDATLIMGIPVIGILTISLLVNLRKRNFRARPLIIALATFVVFGFSIIIFQNSVVLNYLFNFVIYGAIPMYFLAFIPAFTKFFQYCAYLSIPVLLLFALDPLNNYAITGDYMVYGYYIMLPVFTAFYIARKYYRLTWLFIFEIITLLLIIAFANRGATLAAITLIILANLFVDKINIRKVLAISLGVLLALVVALNIKPILEWSITTTKDTGNSSYALETFYRSLEGETNGLSGRDVLWSHVPVLYDDSPLIGHGIGAFEDKNEIYAHNIFLEILVSFGIIGVTLSILYLLSYIHRMFGAQRVDRLPYVLGISIGLVPLLFSMQPFIWYYFWLFTVDQHAPIKLPVSKRIKSGDK